MSPENMSRADLGKKLYDDLKELRSMLAQPKKYDEERSKVLLREAWNLSKKIDWNEREVNERELSEQKIAHRLGIHRNAINRLLRGEAKLHSVTFSLGLINILSEFVTGSGFVPKNNIKNRISDRLRPGFAAVLIIGSPDQIRVCARQAEKLGLKLQAIDAKGKALEY